MSAHASHPGAAPAAHRLTVLQSVGEPDDTTNPYIVQLLDAMPEDDVAIRHFSMRAALFSSYDLFHVHWPEQLARHRIAVAARLKQACFALLLARLWLARVPVVRTLHNVQPHEQGDAIERLLLRGLDRLTTRRIQINAAGNDAGNEPFNKAGHAAGKEPGSAAGHAATSTDTILHGHYRDWFAHCLVPPHVRGRLLCFGLIRPYKGVEALLAAFAGLDDPAATLRIVGNPANAAMRDTVEAACAADPRASARLEYVSDAVLAREIGQAQCVVLPYRNMLNSGALLLALSLARPVLVPRSEANIALVAEVGADWVRLYDGELDAATLAAALEPRELPRPGRSPDLSRRDWPVLGRQHHATYLAALAARSRH
ncbi:MAG: glycosyltransferase [Pseudoxanthomonas sp.]|nr:glycosyltransferase [Pseudoxanthomonas sp.]